MLERRASLGACGGIALVSLMLLSSTGLAQPSLPYKLDVMAGAVTIRYPAGWSSPPKRFANMDELLNVPAGRQDT